jgi:hypothetical protein
MITNHSHDDSGDLYIGPDLCATVEQVRSQTDVYFFSLIAMIVHEVSISTYFGDLYSVQTMYIVYDVLWCSCPRTG